MYFIKSTKILIILIISFICLTNDVESACVKYNRRLYRLWIDVDRDCQNTRAEVLLRENIGIPFYKKGSNCVVRFGKWYDPYTGKTFVKASDLDIDHVVPLKEAYRSGAWRWDKVKRREYANYLGYSKHLMAVSKSANRSKRDKDPFRWLPSNKDYHIEYAKIWIEIKNKWGLTANHAEIMVLKKILRNEKDIRYPVEEPEMNCDTSKCCKICVKSKACGNNCISIKYKCTKPNGCACNG